MPSIHPDVFPILSSSASTDPMGVSRLTSISQFGGLELRTLTFLMNMHAVVSNDMEGVESPESAASRAMAYTEAALRELEK